MSEINDINERSNDIKTLVRFNKIETAIEKLLDFAADFCTKEFCDNLINNAIQISARFYQFQQDVISGIISLDYKYRHQAIIVNSVLSFIDNFKKQVRL